MTRKITSVTIILAVTAALPAFAADLAVKTPRAIPAAPVPFSSTGCHVGGHLGGVFSEDKTTGILGNSNSFSSAGFIGGGQIGCDYQFAPGWVAGVEGRAAWTSLKNTHPGTVRFPALAARRT
jgi:outer membrane immunogenic protein